MVLKIGRFRKQTKNTLKVLKCGEVKKNGKDQSVRMYEK